MMKEIKQESRYAFRGCADKLVAIEEAIKLLMTAKFLISMDDPDADASDVAIQALIALKPIMDAEHSACSTVFHRVTATEAYKNTWKAYELLAKILKPIWSIKEVETEDES